jgi:hypothetical protein
MASTATGSPVVGAFRIATVGPGYSISTAWRPLYHPQCGHTMCGTFAWWHWGQTLRLGLRSTQFEARRLRLFAFEVFFFGTAIWGVLG